jgi:hypothetical protein
MLHQREEEHLRVADRPEGQLVMPQDQGEEQPTARDDDCGNPYPAEPCQDLPHTLAPYAMLAMLAGWFLIITGAHHAFGLRVLSQAHLYERDVSRAARFKAVRLHIYLYCRKCRQRRSRELVEACFTRMIIVSLMASMRLLP